MGLGIALIYILGILSVIIFLAIRKRCRNRKAQAWFSIELPVTWSVASDRPRLGKVWATDKDQWKVFIENHLIEFE